MKVEHWFLDDIVIGDRIRPVKDAAVAVIAESFKRLGQLQPISVYSPDDGKALLVAGAHRLAAAKLLGWDEIKVVFVTGDEIERELQEIAENLHRNELTTLERDTQVGRWAELTAAKVAQVETPLGGAQPSEKGVRKVAADLGLDKSDVQRAVKVASISDEAKAAAREAGLDDNRAALLEVAKEATPEKQIEKVEQLVAARRTRRSDGELSEEWREKFQNLWKKARTDDDKKWAAKFITKDVAA